ncbi:Maf family protein [Anthocerotibacter panamensis]|uniref:Maf family protein n=1 Tax=Anthocerotibacter panamensis TaxID=2857077 RepID=UPI001C403914|nr:Maf family protein [Anthocerotibacter panamensis]
MRESFRPPSARLSVRLPWAKARRVPPSRSEPLILASSSIYRQGLLNSIGIPFVAIPSPYVEDNAQDLAPSLLVEEQGLGKALTVAVHHPRRLVLGADTLVICEGQVMGKPRDNDDARAMLRRLQGCWHEVYTGMALVQGQDIGVYHEVTKVRMCPLTEAEINWYVNTGEPVGKAGAYGTDELGAVLIQEIRGCTSNVVGLPLPLLFRELKARGWY